MWNAQFRPGMKTVATVRRILWVQSKLTSYRLTLFIVICYSKAGVTKRACVLQSLAQTCLNTLPWKFPVYTLISCFRCVWLGLELNSAGHQSSRTPSLKNNFYWRQVRSLRLTPSIRSTFFIGVSRVPVKLMALALLTNMSIPVNRTTRDKRQIKTHECSKFEIYEIL